MSDLVKRLWESDAASALTNEAARRIEAKDARIEALEAEVAGLSEAHGEQERYLHEAEGLRTRLAAMTEDRDKWAAESAENLRSLAAMTANAEALADAVSLTCRADELREKYHKLPNDHNRIGEKRSKKSHARDAWLRAFRKAAKYSRSALASHAKLMEGK